MPFLKQSPLNYDQESIIKGKKFEKYVEDKLFPNDYYKLVRKTPEYSERSPENITDPDFLFRCKRTKKDFWVEAKYRSRFDIDDKLYWVSKVEQSLRYRNLHSEAVPVFIVIGYEGISENPNNISLIPITKIFWPGLFRSFLEAFKIKKNEAVSPDYLWSLLGDNNSPAPPILNTSKRKKSIIFSFLAISIIFLLGYFVFQKNTPNPSSQKAFDNTLLKKKIENYHLALQNNNVIVLDNYLNVKMDRWFDESPAYLPVIKMQTAAYYKKYPHHKVKLIDKTFKFTNLPNGDCAVEYMMKYDIMKKGKSNYTTYLLIRHEVWDNKLKMKSLYEERLNR